MRFVFVGCWALRVVGCVLIVVFVRCLLFVVGCCGLRFFCGSRCVVSCVLLLLCIVRCVLFVVCCLLFVVVFCLWLFIVVCCSLFVVCCVSSVVSCFGVC